MVTKKMYQQIISVHGSSVLTVRSILRLSKSIQTLAREYNGTVIPPPHPLPKMAHC